MVAKIEGALNAFYCAILEKEKWSYSVGKLNPLQESG